MKKFKVIAGICCAFALCLALAGCGANKESYEGTWDLKYSETINEEEMPGQVYTEEEVANFSESNLSIYMNLEDNGVAILNILGALTNGTWEMDGSNITINWEEPGLVDPDTGVASDTNTATASLSGSTLKMEKSNTAFYFEKGEDKDPYNNDGGIVYADENGLSTIIADGQGEVLNDPIEVADDDVVDMTIDGIGVDAVGDPGFNLQVTNKSTDTINVWVPNPFKVGDTDVDVYMYITLNPGQSTTTFMALDYEQIGGTTTDALQNVTGEIQVDNASSGDVLGTYEFTY